jgi:F0F1-type ATP synthase membrane subunit b/b'
MEYVKYSATWVEWALTLAGIATFFLFFTIVSKFVTVIPISEFGEKEKQLVAPVEKEMVLANDPIK